MAGYVTGQSARVPGPSALMVETTVRCNLSCPMCPRTGAGYPNEELPDALLYPLLEDHAWLGGDHVYLYGLGEPMMDPRIFDILARCKRLGLGTVLSSNGTLLTEARREKLLASGCDHLIVGIDGASEATYSYYREGGKFENVLRNVRALAAEKAATKSPMTLVVQFIRMKKNEHETDLFLRQWRHVAGVDEVRIKEEDIGLPEHAAYEHDGHLRTNPCHLLWRGPMIVRWTGDVYPCYHIAGQGRPMANLRERSLAALWNSEDMRQLRELHQAGRASENPHCATCPAARPRLPFVLGAMALRGTTVRRLVPIAEKAALAFPSLFSERRIAKG